MSKKKNLLETKKHYYKRNLRLKELGYDAYEDYLKSKHWKEKRKQKPKESCLCGCDKNLELHHKTYKRVGEERLNDLIWLCRECHEKVHEAVNEGRYTLWRGLKAIKPKKKRGVKKSKRQKRKEKKERKKNLITSHPSRVRKAKRKQKDYYKFRSKQVNDKIAASVAIQKYKVAFREWLSNGDYSIPKPDLKDF